MQQKSTFTITVTKEGHKTLAALAKEFRISQGEAIEVMLNNLQKEQVADAMNEVRIKKLQARGTKTAISELKDMGLSPSWERDN